jgi:SAM-dependent methyltransferase
MTGDERAAALRANITAYNNLDSAAYINGAPHLKHSSIANIYSSLVASAVARVGRDPKTISVLELGAGNGLASEPWFKQGVQLTAVDSSTGMLREFSSRAAEFGLIPATVEADALQYLDSTDKKFDVITHVSMLHHIPDYLDLVARSTARVRASGCLITFQDPLRYDGKPRGHHFVDRASYFVWRSAQGNLKRGLKTRWRRLRGVYSPKEVVDFDEYHVVRNGVDSAKVIALLERSFALVDAISYWSTYSRPLQALGERLHLVSSFGILASGRAAN